MKTREKANKIIYFSALVIYVLSLFLPYYIEICQDEKTRDGTTNGFDLIVPLFISPIFLILGVFIFSKHNDLRRWIFLTLSAIGIFPLLPFVILTTQITWFCTSTIREGTVLYSISTILLFIAGIRIFRNKDVVKKDFDQKDLLDRF